jgi:kynureninase
MTFQNSYSYAKKLDKTDELGLFRDRFVVHDPDLIYLDGNSLGRLPTKTPGNVNHLIDHQWGDRLIRSWNEAWYDLPERVGASVSRLLGAGPDEVIMADSTSVNLFKLAMAAIQARPGRTKIVTDNLNFPSDLYILQGICRLAGSGYGIEIVQSSDGIHGPIEALAKAIDHETALVTLSHTAFKSSYTYPLGEITELAHRSGALMLWDTSHSVGAMPIDLNAADVDLAIGCSYKYLNGGPGAPAFLYIKEALQEQMTNPISGWMGQDNPFDFALEYRPIEGLRRFLSGTPPVLSLAAVQAGVELLLEAGLDQLREKSVKQTEYLIDLWETELAPLGFRLKTPKSAGMRGSHVTLGHEEGLRIDRALIEEMKVLPDFRTPDNIRLGIAPIYNSFEDIHAAVAAMARVVKEGIYEKYPRSAMTVT